MLSESKLIGSLKTLVVCYGWYFVKGEKRIALWARGSQIYFNGLKTIFKIKNRVEFKPGIFRIERHHSTTSRLFDYYSIQMLIVWKKVIHTSLLYLKNEKICIAAIAT